MVRVGGQSQSPELDDINLRAVSRAFARRKHERAMLSEAYSELRELMETARSALGLLNDRRIKVYMRTHNLKRASSDIIENMLGWRRWPDTEEYRKNLRKEREQSKKLERICSGKYRGLLCFLPHEDSPLDLAEQKILLLVRRDDIVATLCKLGTDFEDLILGDKEVPVYVLEDKGLAELEQLSLEARAALLTQK